MAGTLTLSTLSDGSTSTSATNVINGPAKVWVNFNGTGTVAVRSSYNVSSITDNGTGDYTVNFTNAMANANYCAVVTNVGLANGDTRRNSVIAGNQTTGPQDMATTQIRVNVGNPAAISLEDNSVVCVAIFGV